MKSNLDSLFKRDEETELNDVWLSITPEVGFLVKRFGGSNKVELQKAMKKFYNPFARMIEKGTLDEKRQEEIMTQVFVHACVKDWKGIEIDGELKAFDKDLCVKYLLGLPELSETLVQYAQDPKNYRPDVDLEGMGNS